MPSNYFNCMFKWDVVRLFEYESVFVLEMDVILMLRKFSAQEHSNAAYAWTTLYTKFVYSERLLLVGQTDMGVMLLKPTQRVYEEGLVAMRAGFDDALASRPLDHFGCATRACVGNQSLSLFARVFGGKFNGCNGVSEVKYFFYHVNGGCTPLSRKSCVPFFIAAGVLKRRARPGEKPHFSQLWKGSASSNADVASFCLFNFSSVGRTAGPSPRCLALLRMAAQDVLMPHAGAGSSTLLSCAGAQRTSPKRHKRLWYQCLSKGAFGAFQHRAP